MSQLTLLGYGNVVSGNWCPSDVRLRLVSMFPRVFKHLSETTSTNLSTLLSPVKSSQLAGSFGRQSPAHLIQRPRGNRCPKTVLSTQTMSLPLSVYIGSNKRYSWVVCLVWCLDSWATWYLKHALQTRERKKVSRWSNFLVVLAYQPYSFIKLLHVSLTSDSGCGGNWLW